MNSVFSHQVMHLPVRVMPNMRRFIRSLNVSLLESSGLCPACGGMLAPNGRRLLNLRMRGAPFPLKAIYDAHIIVGEMEVPVAGSHGMRQQGQTVEGC